jgi:S-formylglutathione hydrolase FrmB
MRVWGDPILQHSVWTTHNPATKAAKLKGTKLFVSSGNGQAGPFDPPTVDPTATALEQVMETSSKSFVAKLQQAGVDVTSDFYGPGVHNWPYWEREFHRSWPMLAESLGVAA